MAGADDAKDKDASNASPDPYGVACEAIEGTISLMKTARDAKMRTGLMRGSEAQELWSSYSDFEIDMRRVIKISGLLLTRLDGDDPAKLALAALLGCSLGAVGAAVTLGRHCSLPGAGDFQAVAVVKARMLRERKAQKDEGRLTTIAYQIIEHLSRPLWDADRPIDGKYKHRGRHTPVADEIYVSFCGRIRPLAPAGSSWHPPEIDLRSKGDEYEKYRGKMLNGIRKAFTKWKAEAAQRSSSAV